MQDPRGDSQGVRGEEGFGRVASSDCVCESEGRNKKCVDYELIG